MPTGIAAARLQPSRTLGARNRHNGRSHEEEAESIPARLERGPVQRVLDHYETQSDVEAVAEDEAAYRSTTTTVMKIPVKLVPAVRALLAKRRAS